MSDTIKVTFRDPHGEEQTVDVRPHGSLMEAAMLNNVVGIIAECGGGCSCATCHVYVDDVWVDRLPAPVPEESDLIEFLEGVRPTSRLSCQLELGPELDGLGVSVPPEQI